MKSPWRRIKITKVSGKAIGERGLEGPALELRPEGGRRGSGLCSARGKPPKGFKQGRDWASPRLKSHSGQQARGNSQEAAERTYTPIHTHTHSYAQTHIHTHVHTHTHTRTHPCRCHLNLAHQIICQCLPIAFSASDFFKPHL